VKSLIIKFVAVPLMITALLITVLLFGGSIVREMLTCVGVLRNAQRYKTLTWKVIFTVDETATVQAMALEPYYVRVELPDGTVWLLDRHDGKVILMNPAEKMAEITFIKHKPPHIYDVLSSFKYMSRLSSEQISRRRIGQKQEIGFTLGKKNGDDDMIVWIDPQSQLPVRVEFLGKNEQGQREPVIIWRDIVFDVELDESLFKPDLTGYEVKELDSFRASYDYIGGLMAIATR